MQLLTLLCLATLACWSAAEVDIISEPRPGQEYVFVQTSGAGARPIARKEKSTDAADRPFETAHKFPSALTFRVQDPADAKIKEKREAAKVPSAAPPGSIKIDPKKLIEKYRHNVESLDIGMVREIYARSLIETSTNSPSITTTTKKSRTKKEAPSGTTPNSVLTTGAPSTPRTLQLNDGSSRNDDKLAASSSENKRSRIQIKKGPNGQEYEYEYVYYYYDDDEDETASAKEKVSNSHDGPQRNSVSGRGSRYSTSTVHPEPAANEVVPSTRGGRGRGRQLNQDLASDEKVSEERLPLNTRFPPRSRNINTTPGPTEEEEEAPRTRGRPRGKPQAIDNAADETQVSGRGRNRANVRRPSLELVDSASFNTHSSNDPGVEPYKEPKARGEHVKDSSSGPSFPSELPDGPVRFLGATPNEKTDLQDTKSRISENEETNTEVAADISSAATTEESGTTTEMSAMDKVALDLYAILQGTQKLSGDEKEENRTDEADATTTEAAEITDATTTEEVTTEEITTPTITTTTTTTTTTPAPTTTTSTTEAVTGRGRFRGRPGAGGNRFKSSGSTTTAAPEPSTEKPKGRFGRPGFGNRARPGARTTTEASVESEVTKEESKPLARPATGSRTRFGGRARPTTTAAPGTLGSDSTTVASSSRPGLARPRPGSFNLRRRPGAATTKEPAEGGEDVASEAPAVEEGSSTTAKPIRGRVNGNLARPLRPGPRINLATRGRPGAGTTTSTVAPDASPDQDSTPEEAQHEEEKTGETTPQPVADKNPLNKLRNRPKINVAARPKPAASAAVQVRRTNPLLARRKPVVNTEPSEAPTEPPQEPAATEAEAEEETPSEAPSSTTEEPRGLNKLLAGRRRLIGRLPANH